ncbi:unnamed protein product [Peronospora belbahrii]|uniref:Uncharacterized protein n=1 Tax=Peronospora belbahrii TaxID=622444 RepID=A0ABN8CPS8_9STRA|nr:unnamed protein product [Peronospora belbahrii]
MSISEATGELSADKEAPQESSYYYKGVDLLAEDVDQHMAILSEIVTPTTEVDIRMGDTDVPLTEDQEQHVVQFAMTILMKRPRSHNVYDW